MLIQTLSMLTLYQIIVFTVIISMMIITVKTKKLTYPAAAIATGIGFLVYTAARERGIVMLILFFILSVAATAHNKKFKNIQLSLSQSQERKAGQVFANGGVAGILAILILLDPGHSILYILMMACSLSSALADTLSSELGIVYGRNFVNILTFKKELRGLDGVVSMEGTAIGAIGAGIIAITYAGFNRVSLIVLFSGIIGNLSDSILGAALERKDYISNNVVNFLNTSIAAFVGMALYLIFQSKIL
jgi:uncharacterized protein (TIGR00297 family)